MSEIFPSAREVIDLLNSNRRSTGEQVVRLVHAVIKAPGIGLKYMAGCAHQQDLRQRAIALIGPLKVFIGKQERSQEGVVHSVSPTGVLEMALMGQANFATVTNHTLALAQKACSSGSGIDVDASPAQILGVQHVLEHAKSPLAESMTTRGMEEVFDSFGVTPSRSELIKILVGKYPDSAKDVFRMLCSITGIHAEAPPSSIITDVETLCNIFANMGLAHLRFPSFSALINEACRGTVSYATKTEHAATLCEVVVCQHVKDQGREFKQQAAANKEFKPFTSLSPRASAALSAFSAHFGTLSMRFRQDFNTQGKRKVEESYGRQLGCAEGWGAWGSGRGGGFRYAPQHFEMGAVSWPWPQQQLQLGAGQSAVEQAPPFTSAPPRTYQRTQGKGGKGEQAECRDFARGVCSRGPSCKFLHSMP
jgi:hypothetical protein